MHLTGLSLVKIIKIKIKIIIIVIIIIISTLCVPQAAEMVTNMAFKSQQAETAQNSAAAAGSSRLLLEGSKGKKGVWGTEVEDDIELDQKKLKAALEKVAKHNQGEAVDERKRGYNSFAVRRPLPGHDTEFYAPGPVGSSGNDVCYCECGLSWPRPWLRSQQAPLHGTESARGTE